MPITPKQKELLKDRADEAMKAQQHARGSGSDLSGPSALRGPPKTQWQAWPAECHSDPAIQGSDWAREAVAISNAGALKFGNHICLPQVCYKRGKSRFCRMKYWYWDTFQDSKGELMARRRHGIPLQPCPPTGEMPLQTSLPHRGQPALERTHPFHFKMTPGAMLANCCNHDLSVLFRFGDFTPDMCSTQRGLLLKDMIETITDHEYYIGGYMAKGAESTQGLLHCLHDATLQHARVKATAQGETAAAAQNASNLFRRLILALNKRHRMGFPSVYAYIFGKPSIYSSHTFVSLNLTATFQNFETCVEALNFVGVPPHVRAQHPSAEPHAPPASRAPTYTGYDYNWRPLCLEHFPLYFFIAGTDTVTAQPAPGGALPWPLLHDDSGELRRHPCYERRYADDRYLVRSATVRDETGTFAVLTDPATGLPLRYYDHYRKLRVDTPWRVPELLGYVPRKPTDGDPPELAGRYALYVLLLFRPWRNVRAALASWTGLSTATCVSTTDVWTALTLEYERWREELRALAAQVSASPKPPRYNSAQWWALLTYDKVRNFELTAISKSSGARQRPTDAAGNLLPTESDSDDGHSSNRETSHSHPTSSKPQTSAVDAPSHASEDPPQPERLDSDGFKRCGNLGAGFCSHFVYAQENTIQCARGVEAQYARGCVDVLQGHELGVSHAEVVPQPAPWDCKCPLTPDALQTLYKKQQDFFKEIDEAGLPAYSPETPCKTQPGRSETSPAAILLGTYPGKSRFTPTCAIDAAVWLIQNNIVQIPSFGETNVKQACRGLTTNMPTRPAFDFFHLDNDLFFSQPPAHARLARCSWRPCGFNDF